MNVELLAITPNCEELIEQAGRICRRSEMGENPGDFVRSLIEMRHLSIVEHVTATFLIEGISRICSLQLINHRIAKKHLASKSQESQRHCEPDDDVIVPPSIYENPFELVRYKLMASNARRCYKNLVKAGIPREDARFILPGGTQTRLVFTMNFSAWRHFIQVRHHDAAQWEIRAVAERILLILSKEAPSVFDDLLEKQPPLDKPPDS